MKRNGPFFDLFIFLFLMVFPATFVSRTYDVELTRCAHVMMPFALRNSLLGIFSPLLDIGIILLSMFCQAENMEQLQPHFYLFIYLLFVRPTAKVKNAGACAELKFCPWPNTC